MDISYSLLYADGPLVLLGGGGRFLMSEVPPQVAMDIETGQVIHAGASVRSPKVKSADVYQRRAINIPKVNRANVESVPRTTFGAKSRVLKRETVRLKRCVVKRCVVQVAMDIETGQVIHASASVQELSCWSTLHPSVVYMYIFIYMYIYLSIYLSIYLFIYLSSYLSIDLSTCI